MRRIRLGVGGAVVVLGLVGCGEESLPEEPREVVWPHLECDPIVPTHCGYPFPNNVFTVDDASTPTGRRLALPETVMPKSSTGVRIDATPFNAHDGFSTGLGIAAHLPGATVDGLANPLTIERSLADDSPTIVIEAETGRRIAHFAELDMSALDPERRAFLIRPVERLADATRYIVAIRNVKGEGGEPLPPSEAFAALRDRTASEDPAVESRRGLYGDIFYRLNEAGIERDDLQLAWDFTTSSRENNTNALVHMRDVAFDLVGPDGPDYTISSIEENPAEGIAMRVNGKMTVPLFLDQTGPGASHTYGDDGLPAVNPDMPWAEFPFTVWIPEKAYEEPAALAQFGHGLFGTQEEPKWFEMPFVANYNYVLFAVDWIGFAEEDEIHIGGVVASGEFEKFKTAVDRLDQGVLNSLLAMRMMKGGFANEEQIKRDGRSPIDPSRRYYFGSSQGGILGGTYMALTTDVERGMLDTTGQPYNLLLPRSANFDIFFAIMNGVYADSLDVHFVLELAQILWDQNEPNGFTPYIAKDALPGTPTHQVLIRPAVGDHQVTTLGAHIMARAVGAKHLDTGIRDVWGLEKLEVVNGESALVEYDFGLPPEPIENVPMRECGDPHDVLREVPEGQEQLDRFFRTGEIRNFCNGGRCSFPELSGC